MKTNPPRLPAAVLFAVMMSVYGVDTANAQRIDPATGLPASHNNSLSTSDRELLNKVAHTDVEMYGWPAYQVDGMIIQGQYDEALQLLRQYVHRVPKDKAPGDQLVLIRWFVLGEKFPKAREALIEVRDQDAQEFYHGRGSPGLFAEVQMINGWLARTGAALHPDAAACALFKIIHERNRSLAVKCYPEAECWLVQDGEYQLCLNYIGDPQARFTALRNKFERQIALLPRIRESALQVQRQQEKGLNEYQQRQEESRRKVQEMLDKDYTNRLQFEQEIRQNNPGAPPQPPPPRFMAASNTSVFHLRWHDLSPAFTNDFVNGVRTLVEILAGTGNKSEAEKIQAQAVAVLDDPRLKSAVTDAERNTGK